MKRSVLAWCVMGLAAAGACAGLGGCGSDYMVVGTQTSYMEEDGSSSVDHNTIMVDRATGRSWMLWSGDNFEAGGESGYYWVPLKQVDPTLPPELAKTPLVD